MLFKNLNEGTFSTCNSWCCDNINEPYLRGIGLKEMPSIYLVEDRVK